MSTDLLSSMWRRLACRPVWESLALALAYFVTARLCVFLADTGKNPAALWIPSGVALAGLLHFGRRVWPGVFLGSLAANVVVGLTMPSAVLLALGNALDALVAVWGITRVTGRALDFGRTRHVLAYVVYGVVIGPGLSAAVGVLSLHLDQAYDSLAKAATDWTGWALEDGLSVLIVSSLLLLIPQARFAEWRRRGKLIEAGLLLCLLGANSWLVLAGPPGEPRSEPYLVLPLMLFVVLRLGTPGAIIGNLLLTVLAGWALVTHHGPFVLDTLPASMLWMQAFSTVASLTTLLLAAALNEARSERYRQMFDGNQAVQLVLDQATGRIVDANPAACEFYGYPSSGMRKLTVRDLSSGPIASSADVMARIAGAGGGNFVRRHRTASGEVREVEVQCNPIRIDGRLLMYAIVHDMSARRRAEEALRQSEERLQLVARATNDTVWDWDMRANTMWHNHGLRSVFGHADADAATGLAEVASLIHEDERDRVLANIQAAAAGGDETWSQEFSLRRGDGSYAHVLARGYILYENATAVRMVGVLLDLSDRKRMEEELAHRATHDILTGLANRSLVETTLEEAIVHTQRHGGSMGLLLADLDRFKGINDTLGHRTGDAVLQVVAERWRSALRPGDMLGRLAGDEFAVILPGADAEAARAIALRLVRALEQPISLDGHELSVGTSVGLATCPADGADPERLVRCADHAMYTAKRAGGGCVSAGSSEPGAVEPAPRAA